MMSSALFWASSLAAQYSALPWSLWYRRPLIVRYCRIEEDRDAVLLSSVSPRDESASSSFPRPWRVSSNCDQYCAGRMPGIRSVVAGSVVFRALDSFAGVSATPGLLVDSSAIIRSG